LISQQPLLIYITQRDDRDRVAETLIARPWPESEILVVDSIPKGRLFGDLSLKMALKICLNGKPELSHRGTPWSVNKKAKSGRIR
jgi:hypothetical protein